VNKSTLLDDPLAWWRAKFGILAPIGYELRGPEQSPWTRIHSLPHSKRYPNTPAEYAELSRRGSAVANAIFGVGELIFGYHSVYAFDDVDAPPIPPELRALLRVPRAKFQVEAGEANVYTQAFVGYWPLDGFEALVHHVADENIKMLSFVSATTRNVLCPYDGGFDMFTQTPSPDELRTQFAQWLSPLDDYL
jgi:hypothetical protein